MSTDAEPETTVHRRGAEGAKGQEAFSFAILLRQAPFARGFSAQGLRRAGNACVSKRPRYIIPRVSSVLGWNVGNCWVFMVKEVVKKGQFLFGRGSEDSAGVRR